jgi:hypothetical protein
MLKETELQLCSPPAYVNHPKTLATKQITSLLRIYLVHPILSPTVPRFYCASLPLLFGSNVAFALRKQYIQRMRHSFITCTLRQT